MEQITFVTGNKNKLKEIKSILGDTFPITNLDLDLSELQGTAEEICIAKCIEAVHAVNGPAIIEDTSLVFKVLDNMPGPYIKWFMGNSRNGYNNLNGYNNPNGCNNLTKMLDGFDDRSAYALCTVAIGIPVKYTMKPTNVGICSMLEDTLNKERKNSLTKNVIIRDDDIDIHLFTGRVDGTISKEPRGPTNFGWDPIFIPNQQEISGESKTFAEMDPKFKNSISHRKRAIDQLCDFLKSIKHNV